MMAAHSAEWLSALLWLVAYWFVRVPNATFRRPIAAFDPYISQHSTTGVHVSIKLMDVAGAGGLGLLAATPDREVEARLNAAGARGRPSVAERASPGAHGSR